MNYQIILTTRAKFDLMSATRWWSENHSESQALSWYEAIIKRIQTLKEDPLGWPIVVDDELTDTELRQLHFGLKRKATHRVIYSVEGENVVVLRIRHSAQKDLGPNDLS